MMDTLSKRNKHTLEVFLKLLHTNNIYFYYIFPFTGNSCGNFTGSAINSVHISKDLKFIYINPKTMGFKEKILVSEGKNFLYFVELKDISFMVFKVKKEFKPDIIKLLAGNITSINQKSKLIICKNCGLPYNERKNGMYYSSRVLQVLYPDNPVKELLAAYFDIPLEDLPDDLTPVIGEDSKLYIENWMGS